MNIAVAFPITAAVRSAVVELGRETPLDCRHVLAGWLGFWRRDERAELVERPAATAPSRTTEGL